MLKKVTPLLLVAAVSACSTPLDRRQANGSDDFINAETSPLLTIPEGLNTPTYSKEYEIPAVGTKSDKTLIGKKLDIRAPLQVLPMAEGTHIEESTDNIRVVIDSIESTTDLKQEIFDVVKAYLTKNNMVIRAEDYAAGVIETDWIEHEEVIESSWWGSDKVYTLRQRYSYNIDVKPHGRSGSVAISLLEHEEFYNGEDQKILLSGDDKRRYTTDMLNNAIGYMSVERDRAIRAARIQQSLGIKVDLVTGTGSDAAYWLADANYQSVWDRLRLVLPEMGFDVVDMDTSKGLFFINLEESSGFWSSLWGDEKLSLKKGNYRLLLKETDNPEQTKILLHDVEDNALDNEAITEVYQILSDLMQEDRKVR
ncbi:outer membrane protein assembly factor BamC [Shewanella ulleungensis]|jgi:outer membrane protein assembly factor BamC|uniref:Outer membrane protein assembly factor BamC n=1 Tax=Shewanella ulleungensis TaxID=2282699 RepID=A0ABQ2QFE6_9GAMM|nr:outer membrane protein assembly factor BamC [Shewanella ulleungensis]MCL1148605.1 outer membrane protein assembly factor BamC [Shewanella ulleungensis]GGP76806.1 outer membrane protein assembly factor BamC [Shewanella ulleungensis]